MQQNALIQIKGIQYLDDDNDVVELTTVGSFFKKNNAYYIRYDESEATGFEGSRTTLKVEGNSCVTMQRTGTAQSQLIIEKGQRHQCLYSTGYGELVMGVSCDKITSSLSSEGGKLHFKYTLDLNASMASQNEVYVVVKRTDARSAARRSAAAAAEQAAAQPQEKPEAAPEKPQGVSRVRPVKKRDKAK